MTGLCQTLRDQVDSHHLWRNPLLTRIANEGLAREQWGFLCGHHMLYSAEFTRFLAVLFAAIPASYDKGCLLANLIEEEGEGDPAQSHANILRIFVRDSFGEAALSPDHADLSTAFAGHIMQSCTASPPPVGVAVLAFACEAVAPRLYRCYVEGMRKCGLDDDELRFFLMHIECDDGHADQLSMLLAQLASDYPQAAALAEQAVAKALDARDDYLTALNVWMPGNGGMDELIDLIATSDVGPRGEGCVLDGAACQPSLYRNRVSELGIDFAVERIALPATVLDPRRVRVEAHRTTEFHAHAHESLFYVVAGTGRVRIGDREMDIVAGDFCYVPRWVGHQTINNSDDRLEILAVTDHGLTKRIRGNGDERYRLNKSAM